jgi:uncharacterized protein YcbX
MAGEGLRSCSVAELGIPGDRGWAVRDEAAGEIRNGRKIPKLLLCSAHYPEEPGPEKIPPAEIRLPEGSTLQSDAPDASAVLSELLGREVTLWPRLPAEDLDHYRRGKPDHADREQDLAEDLDHYRRGKPDHADREQDLREIMSRLEDEPLPDFSIFPSELSGFSSRPGTYFDAFPIHLVTTASLAWLKELHPGTDGNPERFRPNFLLETEGDARRAVEADWCGRELQIGEARLAVEIPTVRCGIPSHAHARFGPDRKLLRTIVREMEQNMGVYASVRATGRVSVGDRVELL